MSARERLVLALDVDDFSSAENLVGLLKDYVGVFKVGSQLFTSEGTKIIDMITKAKARVFLDLKFHDIPNTVKGAAESATKLGVYMFNVHASGGYEMMKAAADAAIETSIKLGIKKPLILGVTVLTSINQEILEKEVGVNKAVKEHVVHLAKLAKSAGLDGVVASPHEIKDIRDACGKNFIILTPGIRPAGEEINDQKRIMTPKQALEQGADFIVIGRPIRNAENPVEAAKNIIKEMERK
ncbi:orotidine-5'-phosphate decarboxylase [Candidatus Woesearchaeota archaeon CG_4_10_14_0_2_um_filter_33_10]|nr:MAG: orotidine-5'-phosphate decarboxylase [Candidatus Woesearchaeota archaeon CG06_land_8_20_14_3_00_33_13]PIZ52581.1 MAG: orotidine-5'-phosphate decarboxylase [Candidatus Woesearchaeota archaeon CG_4_10_14_0_2_um_filter_33_10]